VRGTLHSIIGPNGAGKTTFFNVVSGYLPATSGRIVYNGQDITQAPMHRRAHVGMGRSFQITNLFPNLTVLENIRLSHQAVGKNSFRLLRSHRRFGEHIDRADAIINRVGLTRYRDLPARTLAHGDQRKLELGMILAADPEMLLLDEPTAGMASDEVPELMALIQEIQAEGSKTVLLVEHNMNVVMNVSDMITVMHHGEVLAEGTPAEISSNETVQQAYLGNLYENLQEASDHA
ncbi:MAG: ABC transporter ATP-binding protein, partial [Anaerolineae bacterium]